MNLHHLSIVSLVAALLGGASLGAGLSRSPASMQYCVLGGVLIAAAGGGLYLVFNRTREALRRMRAYLDASDGELPAPPDLAEPFGVLARAFHRRLLEIDEGLKAQRSEARRARTSLRSLSRRHEVLTSLLESMSDGVLLIDPTGSISFLNGSARRLLGLPEDADPPASAAALPAPPPLRVALDEALSGSLAESRAVRDVDCSDQAQRLVLRLALLEVTTPDSGLDELSRAVILTDVTREVELNRMKSNFASSVSHELKTPLCSMKAFLEMLLDGDIEGEEEEREHIQLILDETERLTSPVQNLLNLSRLEAGITRMEREPVSVVELLEHLRDVVSPLARARNQTVVFEISEFLPSVTGDRNLLEQAFMNLISNAIKYTPEGGSIRVKAGISGQQVELTVVDTGVGIPQKALALVFEKFTRIENSAGLQATGTGLGLPLAKFVAEAHGGGVSVSSEVGVGSEFMIALPVRRGEECGESQLVGLEGISA